MQQHQNRTCFLDKTFPKSLPFVSSIHRAFSPIYGGSSARFVAKQTLICLICSGVVVLSFCLFPLAEPLQIVVFPPRVVFVHEFCLFMDNDSLWFSGITNLQKWLDTSSRTIEIVTFSCFSFFSPLSYTVRDTHTVLFNWSLVSWCGVVYKQTINWVVNMIIFFICDFENREVMK